MIAALIAMTRVKSGCVPEWWLTIEPGLYFGPQAKQNPREVPVVSGIRIEDDVLVTEDGCRASSRRRFPKNPTSWKPS